MITGEYGLLLAAFIRFLKQRIEFRCDLANLQAEMEGNTVRLRGHLDLLPVI